MAFIIRITREEVASVSVALVNYLFETKHLWPRVEVACLQMVSLEPTFLELKFEGAALEVNSLIFPTFWE